MRRGTRATLGAVLLAVIAAVAWWAWGGSRGAVDVATGGATGGADAASQAGTPPPPASDTSQAGLQTAERSPAPKPPEPASPPPTGRARVHGTVRFPEATPEGTVVWVATEESGRPIVGRMPPDAKGAYGFDLAVARERPTSVVVGVSAPGWANVIVSFQVSAGDDVPIDLVVPEQFAARGRVVDTRGAPVAGLRLALSPIRNAGTTFDRPRDPANEGTLRGAVEGGGTTTTDERGAFVLRGLRQAPRLDADSFDERWWIDSVNSQAIVPGGEPATLVARQGFRLEVDLRPQSEGDARASWGPLLVNFLSREGEISTGISTGPESLPIVLRGGVPDGAQRGFTCSVTAVSVDHAVATADVALRPDGWSERVSLPLVRRPPHENATLLITTTLRAENGEPAAISVTQDVSLGGRTVSLPVPSERRGDAWAVSLAAGRPSITVYAEVPLRDLFRWKGVVDAPAGRDATLKFPEVEPGRLVVRVPDAYFGKRLQVTLEADGTPDFGHWSPQPTSTFSTAIAVPPGRYRARVSADSIGKRWREPLQVASGVETILDLTK